MAISLILNPEKEQKTIDFYGRIERALSGPWEMIGLSAHLWILVRYYDSGVVDHPLRQAGGHEGGKACVRWHQRQHEVLGAGVTEQAAARGILLYGRSIRLRARQIAIVGSCRLKLVFQHLDSGQIYDPPEILALSAPS